MTRLFRRSIIVILALIGLILGIYTVIIGRKKPPTPPILFAPAVSPYAHFVAGSGIVEAASENISIGSPFNEVIECVYVYAGDIVKVGDSLFSLSIKSLEAQLRDAKANFEVALSNYEKQLALPRPEDVPPVEAEIKQGEVQLQNEKDQLALYERIRNPKSISQNEFNQRRYATQLAEFQLEGSVKRLELLKAGAWIRDLEIYRNEVKKAQAQVEIIETNIERSIVRAPYEGEVLQVNIRRGEFAQAIRAETPLILFGVNNPMHIRIDIDEDDAWRVYENAPGRAYVRGNSSIYTPIEYVRIEPYIIPKRSLTGDNIEKVDTRVLQVIYRFKKEELPIYFGQLMDVFLEAKPNPGIDPLTVRDET